MTAQKEGLTLNAEQAEALRAWYDWLRDVSKTHKLTTRAVRLSDAIAPLMKPWWAQRYELGWMLYGPGVKYFLQPQDFSMPYEADAIRRLVDALNESEVRHA